MRDKRSTVRLRVGKTIQRLRLSRGFSQERLAELADNSVNNMGQIERGEVNVGLDTLARIARALSVELEDLVVNPSRSGRRQPSVFPITSRDIDHIERMLRRIRARRTPRPVRRGR